VKATTTTRPRPGHDQATTRPTTFDNYITIIIITENTKYVLMAADRPAGGRPPAGCIIKTP
jgi:hypothetical protein